MVVAAQRQFVFDAETHQYLLDGRRLPSVTEIIGATLPGWQADDWYLQRGRALHHGCRLLDEGCLDWATVAPEIEPQIRAWQQFLEDSGATCEAIERPLASERYQYAGTLDRMLNVAGYLTVCDLKSTIAPQVAVQLAAYGLLWPEKVIRGVAVELKDDGTYRAQWLNGHELRRAEQVFLACLTVFNFLMTNNLRRSNGN